MTTRTFDKGAETDHKGARLMFGFFVLIDAFILAAGETGIGLLLAALIASVAISQVRLPEVTPARRKPSKGILFNPNLAARITSTPVVLGVLVGFFWIMAMISAFA